ncbi:hypothetical protein IAU59_007588 [Kwoniella sp. CBS 9459]
MPPRRTKASVEPPSAATMTLSLPEQAQREHLYDPDPKVRAWARAQKNLAPHDDPRFLPPSDIPTGHRRLRPGARRGRTPLPRAGNEAESSEGDNEGSIGQYFDFDEEAEPEKDSDGVGASRASPAGVQEAADMDPHQRQEEDEAFGRQRGAIQEGESARSSGREAPRLSPDLRAGSVHGMSPEPRYTSCDIIDVSLLALPSPPTSPSSLQQPAGTHVEMMDSAAATPDNPPFLVPDNRPPTDPEIELLRAGIRIYGGAGFSLWGRH